MDGYLPLLDTKTTIKDPQWIDLNGLGFHPTPLGFQGEGLGVVRHSFFRRLESDLT